jgi:two-component system chemotaxis sensor kinase CheA
MLVGYIEDLKDYTISFNDALIELEKETDKVEIINTIFRVAHTIKGNSATMQLNKIKEVMHTMEDILYDIREGSRLMTSELVSVLYSCHDFLEDCISVIVIEHTDVNINTEKLLEKLIRIKNTGLVKLSSEINNDVGISDFDEQGTKEFPFTIIEDMQELIRENMNRGLFLYHISIDLDEDTEMKKIKNVLIFNDIEMQGHIIDARPQKLQQEDMANAVIVFNHLHSDFLVLSEKDRSEICSQLDLDVDIVAYECKGISDRQFADYCDLNKNGHFIQDAIDHINKIKIEALDMRSDYVKNEAIEKILNNFRHISEIIKNSESYYAKMIITKMSDVLNSMDKNNISFDVNDMQAFVFLCTKLAELVEDPSLEVNGNFISQIEDRMMIFVEKYRHERRRIGDLLVEEGIISQEDVKDILELQKKEYSNLKFGQVAVLGKKATADDIINTLLKQNDESVTGKAIDSDDFIRISSQKVDLLVEMLGELSIYHTELEQFTKEELKKTDKTYNLMPKITKSIKGIQELSMSLRMVSVKSMLHKLTRISRETAAELGKKITIVLNGEYTEVDKNTAEKVMDPLMHLVRNAIAHGIEDEATRIARGKSLAGQIKISAASRGGHVFFEVSDDGGGIDKELIYNKANEKGMLEEGKIYAEDEILKFIFHPGFSTQEAINSVSGRGVGMNVVEEEVLRIKGRVEIRNELGKGCSFIIKIPMNLAVLNGTIIELEEERYIIPTLYIKQFLTLEEGNWISLQGEKKAVRIRDSIIPIITGEDITRKKSIYNENHIKEVAIIEFEQKQLALMINKVLGRQEIVAKPLNEDSFRAEIFSGASVLSDGNVTKVFDIEALYKLI